jgi:hypothetical protein
MLTFSRARSRRRNADRLRAQQEALDAELSKSDEDDAKGSGARRAPRMRLGPLAPMLHPGAHPMMADLMNALPDRDEEAEAEAEAEEAEEAAVEAEAEAEAAADAGAAERERGPDAREERAREDGSDGSSAPPPPPPPPPSAP